MYASGRCEEDFLSLLQKDKAVVMEARRKYEGFKVWIFVLHDNGENMKRADAYAKEVHKADGWHHFVDWMEGGQTNVVIRVTQLVDWGVDVAVAIQRVGEMVVGGPGVGHAVVQRGLTLAVAVNLCHLDLLHLPVRMATKGGDLMHRANRKTAGVKSWYRITGDSVISIIRSLRDDLYRQMCPSALPPFPSSASSAAAISAAAAAAASSLIPSGELPRSSYISPSSSSLPPSDRLKRLRRLEADVAQHTPSPV
jgi:hypothetical protein